MSKQKVFIPYVRVSRLGGRRGEGYISKEEQLRDIDEALRRHGAQRREEVYEDEDYSGGNMNRPRFQQALAEVRDGKAAGIVVATLDRYSRNTWEALGTLHEIEKLGGRLIAADGDVTLDNGNDEYMATVRFAQGTFARSQARDRFAKSVRNAIERGIHLSVPFGYRRNLDEEAGTKTDPDRPAKALVIDEAEAVVVRLAFKMRADGAGWMEISRRLTETGVLPRPYRRHGQEIQPTAWAHTSLRKMIESEVYVGVAWNGKLRYEDAHPAIVSPDLYKAAHDRLEIRGRRSEPNGGYLLSGLVRCAGCGYVMQAKKGSGPRHSGDHVYYSCRAIARAEGECQERAHVPAREIEPWIQEQFRRDFLSEIEVVGVEDDRTIVEAEERAREAKRRYEQRLAKSLDFDPEADADERAIVEKLVEEAKAEHRTAKRLLAEAKAAARGTSLPADLDVIAWDEASIQDRRHWLSLVYACVVVRKAATRGEVVEERARLLTRDEAPDNATALRTFVAGLPG